MTSEEAASGEIFLLDDSYKDPRYNSPCGRIIIFATEENLRILMNLKLWFIECTFKTLPKSFYQLVAMMSSYEKVIDGVNRTMAFPLVYALLENKREESYTLLLQTVICEARKLDLAATRPRFVVTDFE